MFAFEATQMPSFIEGWSGTGRVVTPATGRGAETKAFSCMYVSAVLTSPEAQFKGLGVLICDVLHCIASFAGCKFMHLHALKALVAYYASSWDLSETTKGIFPSSNLDDSAVRPMVRIVNSTLATRLSTQATLAERLGIFFVDGKPIFTETDRIKAENNRSMVVGTWMSNGFQGFDGVQDAVHTIHTFLTYKRTASGADLFAALLRDLEAFDWALTDAQTGRIKSIRRKILHLRGTYDDDDRQDAEKTVKRSRSEDSSPFTFSGFAPAVHIDLPSSLVESLRLNMESPAHFIGSPTHGMFDSLKSSALGPITSSTSGPSSSAASTSAASSSAASSSAASTSGLPLGPIPVMGRLSSSESLLIQLWPKDQLQTAIDAFKFEAAHGSGNDVLQALLLRQRIISGNF